MRRSRAFYGLALIAVALALSLPAVSERDTVVALTYGVVGFSIFAHGLSIGYIPRKSVAPQSDPGIDEHRHHAATVEPLNGASP